MQDELEDNQEDYHSISNEYWCDLLTTIEVKDNMKMDTNQIKRLATYRESSNYDSNESVRVPCKKRVRNGATPSRKQQGERLRIIMEFSTIAHFARSQECPSKSTCCIALKTVLENVQNRSPSRKYWEDP